ncbi:hypothetical protein [Acinetobacter sp. 1125_18A]|uniref:hypothetical protein n=1 Tax=Acinetobacter sp. 1125_18A TaxID=2605959 RepID=UPI004058468E
MLEIINNNWFIGIVGGSISGLLVWFITNYLFKSKQTQAYIQKVLSVNRELIYSLRSGISQKDLPNLEVLAALRSATSRKYSVDINDIYTNKELAEELIKEVMDSSFIPVESKASFCALLSPLIKEELPKEQLLEDKKIRLDYKNDLIHTMSLTLSILVAVFTFLATVTQTMPNLSYIANDRFLIGIIIPTLTAILATTVAIFSVRISRAKLKKRDHINNDLMGSINKTITSDSRDIEKNQLNNKKIDNTVDRIN